MAKTGFSNGVMFADNVSFTGGLPNPTVTADGQLLIGSTAAPNIRVGTLTSTGNTIAITPGAGTINLETTGGQAITNIDVQFSSAPGTDPVVPTGAGTISILGGIDVASGQPMRTDSILANSFFVTAQASSAQALSNLSNAGMSSFNSAQFSVDANGWVSTIAGPGSIDITPDTGVNVTDSAFNLLGTINGAIGVPVRTQGLLADTLFIGVQTSSAQAVSTNSANGLCHFNSAQFTVDANGFVSSLAGTAPWLDSAGGALANHTGYFATAAAVYTLPAGAANGDMVEIVDTVGGGVVVTASGTDIIQIQNVASSAGGTATSTLKGDSLRLSFRLADQTWYQVPGAGGNWILA